MRRLNVQDEQHQIESLVLRQHPQGVYLGVIKAVRPADGCLLASRVAHFPDQQSAIWYADSEFPTRPLIVQGGLNPEDLLP
jgi:hypothetical protein